MAIDDWRLEIADPRTEPKPILVWGTGAPASNERQRPRKHLKNEGALTRKGTANILNMLDVSLEGPEVWMYAIGCYTYTLIAHPRTQGGRAPSIRENRLGTRLLIALRPKLNMNTLTTNSKRTLFY